MANNILQSSLLCIFYCLCGSFIWATAGSYATSKPWNAVLHNSWCSSYAEPHSHGVMCISLSKIPYLAFVIFNNIKQFMHFLLLIGNSFFSQYILIVVSLPLCSLRSPHIPTFLLTFSPFLPSSFPFPTSLWIQIPALSCPFSENTQASKKYNNK